MADTIQIIFQTLRSFILLGALGFLTYKVAEAVKLLKKGEKKEEDKPVTVLKPTEDVDFDPSWNADKNSQDENSQ